MPGSVCKAAICDLEAQSKLNKGYDKIDAIKGASIGLRVAHSEIYIKHMKRAEKEANQLVMESGE